MDDTVPPVAVKVAVVCPALTVALDGTVTAARLLDNATAAPPVGAALVNVTVQVDVPPLAIVEGEQPKELTSTGALTVIDALFDDAL